MKTYGTRSFFNHVNDSTKQSSITADKVFENELKPLNSKTLDVYLHIDSSLTGWTTNNSVFPHKNEAHFRMNCGKTNVNSIYCEVLANGHCNHCQIAQRKLSSIESSIARFPDIETGGYLLFQNLTKRQKIPVRTSYSALSIASAPAAPESGYSSWSGNSGNLRRRVRASSTVISDFNRKPIGSVRSHSQARPTNSKSVRFEDGTSREHAWSLCSRASNSSSTRKISPMSQEGWSEKQIEAWKLLAPTPPQIDVSQMNVSMYTPKELPGIKIFDESLFVI